MAGTIFGLPLSIQMDDNGDPLAGCKLYIYEAGTSTPATTYEDFGLTTGLELSFPMVADSAGRIPQFWVADGSYRVRLVDAAGNEIFDISSVTAIGASSGTGSSGSGVSETAIFQTGDFIWNPSSGTRTGFVRGNARTIGSSSSGATERASSDCEDLFLHLWNTYSDTVCPVTGGRGATAAADWAANKVIATVDMRGRGPCGLDDMGNSAAGVTPAATYTNSTTSGGIGGASTKVITQGNLPNVNFAVTGATDVDHQHVVAGPTSADTTHTHTFSGTTSGQSQTHTHQYTDRGDTTGSVYASGGGTTPADDTSGTYTTGSASVDHTHTYSGTTSGGSSHAHTISILSDVVGSTLPISGTAASGGSGTAVSILPPVVFGTWFIKL